LQIDLNLGVASNSTLTTFGLSVAGGPGWIPLYIFRGLRHNRKLRALAFRIDADLGEWEFPDDTSVNAATSAAMVDVMRNHNITLSEIQGLTYESESHHKEIEWLLTLNRYKFSSITSGFPPACGRTFWNRFESTSARTSCTTSSTG
jgi:hypothetical protein